MIVWAAKIRPRPCSCPHVPEICRCFSDFGGWIQESPRNALGGASIVGSRAPRDGDHSLSVRLALSPISINRPSTSHHHILEDRFVVCSRPDDQLGIPWNWTVSLTIGLQNGHHRPTLTMDYGVGWNHRLWSAGSLNDNVNIIKLKKCLCNRVQEIKTPDKPDQSCQQMEYNDARTHQHKQPNSIGIENI